MTNIKDELPEPISMADISDMLEPEVQAELKAAFEQMQRVGAALEAALDKRADLFEALAAKRTNGV